MSTTDQALLAQRPLAEYAYTLKKKYNQTLGISRKTFMGLYDMGEIQVSTLFENLLVQTRNSLGYPTRKTSVNQYDFVSVDSQGREVPLGDMKTCVLQKNGDKRRFVISHVQNKIGKIYIVGWNWITQTPNFFCIPPDVDYSHPKYGFKIMVHPTTGERTGGWYNSHAYDTWEKMVVA
jgi:hypothetical protein